MKETWLFKEFTLEESISNGIKGATKQGHKVFTPEEDGFIIQHFDSLNQVEIAYHLGRKPHSIYNRVKKLRNHGLIKSNSAFYGKRFTDVDDNFIRNNRATLNIHQVAEVLGRSPMSVQIRASKLGVSYRKIGIESPQGKLNADDIELIRLLSDEGLSSYHIADKFDVNPGHVRSIVSFHSRVYRDVEDYLSHKHRQIESIDNRN